MDLEVTSGFAELWRRMPAALQSSFFAAMCKAVQLRMKRMILYISSFIKEINLISYLVV